MDSVCRICLTGNTRLHPLKNNVLLNVYEKLSNTKFYSEEARPRALCCFCYRKLQTCSDIAKMADRSEQILSHLFHKGHEATHEYIIDENIGVKQQFSVTTVRFITVGPQVPIKHEPIPTVDIKDEVTTEQDQLLESFTEESEFEDCTDFQLTFKEDNSDQGNDVELTPDINVGQTTPNNLKTSFCCNNCNKMYFLKSKLILHIKKSHSQDKEERYSGNKLITRKSSVIKDKITFSQLKLYSCDLCDKQFNQKGNLARHKITHTGEKPFVCIVCDTQFNRKGNLVSHMRTHTQEKPFACNICDKRFNEKRNLVRHKRKTHLGEKTRSESDRQCNRNINKVTCMKNQTGEKPFACDVCDKQFNRKGMLVKHMRTHTGEKPFACDVCNKSFTAKFCLVSHMLDHKEEKPFSCDVCDKKFKWKCSLAFHMRIHTGEKPFGCNLCSKRFCHKTYLIFHMRSHKEVRPYACDTCDKQFKTRSHIICHLKSHTEERPYACDTCDKQFKLRSHLTRHIISHTEERPYVCDTCDKQFKRNEHVFRHQKTHCK